MKKMEIFFDYACPYCLRSHKYLMELLPKYPDIEPSWQPCEAHPRPENYGQHSDLCIRGMFFARDHGVDLWVYHERIYCFALKDRVDIEDIDTLAQGTADLFADLSDVEAFRVALRSSAYMDELNRSNDYAYEESGVWAVPSYRMEGKKLDAVEGIGVTKRQLDDFMRGA